MRIFKLVAGLTLAFLMTGCASFYVDTATKEIPVAQYKVVMQPEPVRLLFQFQTNGAPNAQATNFLKDQVSEQVLNSRLFSSLLPEGANGAILEVTLENVPITKDAAQKGFVTGLTFGLVGSSVIDGYICTVKFLRNDGKLITKTVRHAIHATIGATSAPTGAVKAQSGEEAIRTMTREVLSNALDELSRDPEFNP